MIPQRGKAKSLACKNHSLYVLQRHRDAFRNLSSQLISKARLINAVGQQKSIEGKHLATVLALAKIVTQRPYPCGQPVTG
jgi:hypothetical protein